ncbi:MAG: choice-of-anchor D domain-containing protein [Deltaproteobacteria bacterium]|nr:choice-of-anchor D domain-containing protein [Deltaproteobacteria bacterium]
MWHRLALVLPALALAACADDAASPPDVELYVDGQRAAEAPVITFPNAIAGKDQLAAQVELKNLGPGAFTLAASPRIEKDDRLAFSVVSSTPDRQRYAAGESLVLSVLFRPHSPGRSDARVVVEVLERGAPFVVDLVGEGISEGAASPALAATLDDAPLVAPGAGFDFGAVTSGERRVARLRIMNAGTGTLVLPADGAVALDDDDAFTAGAPSDRELAAGEGVDVDLTFSPDACAAYESTLTITSAVPEATLVVELRGRGGTNPQGWVDLTDGFAFGPDSDVALADAVSGTRRLTVGNLTVGNFRGHVVTASWDGCALTDRQVATPTSTGVDAQLFGSQVALDDRGALLLVTARDDDEAWIFAPQPDNALKHVAALATFEPGQGHGKGADLAGDGSAAFIGLSLADSGFEAHGAVLAYTRPMGGWVDLPEARWRLWPSRPTLVKQLGTWVQSSADGRVVVAGGFESDPGGASAGAPIVYLWEATATGEDPAWGRPPALAEPDARAETLRLVVPEAARATHAAMAIARDGATVALPIARPEGGLDVHVWARAGATWAEAGDVDLPATAVVFAAGDAASRAAFVADGKGLVLSGESVREIARPDAGWDASAAVVRTWSVPVYGAIAVSPDGLALGGVDRSGDAWLIWR